MFSPAVPRVRAEDFAQRLLAERNELFDLDPSITLAGDQVTSNIIRNAIPNIEELILLSADLVARKFNTSLAEATEATRRAHNIDPTFLESFSLHLSQESWRFRRNFSRSSQRIISRYFSLTNSILSSLLLPEIPTIDLSKARKLADQITSLTKPDHQLYAKFTEYHPDVDFAFEEPFSFTPINPKQDFSSHSFATPVRRMNEILNGNWDLFFRALNGNYSAALSLATKILATGALATTVTVNILLVLNLIRSHIQVNCKYHSRQNSKSGSGAIIANSEIVISSQIALGVMEFTQERRVVNVSMSPDSYYLALYEKYTAVKVEPSAITAHLARTIRANLATHLNQLAEIPLIRVAANISADDLASIREFAPFFRFEKYSKHGTHPLQETLRDVYAQMIQRSTRNMHIAVGPNYSQMHNGLTIHSCAGAPDARQNSRFLQNPLPREALHNFQDCDFFGGHHTVVAIYSAHEMNVADFAIGMMKKGCCEAYLAINLPVPFLDPHVEEFNDSVTRVTYRRIEGRIEMTYDDHAALGYVDDEEKVMSWLKSPPHIRGFQIFIEEITSFGSNFLLRMRIGAGDEVDTIINWTPKDRYLTLPYFETENRRTLTIEESRFAPLVTYVVSLPPEKRNVTSVMNRIRGNLAEVKIGGKTVVRRWSLNDREAMTVCMHVLTAAYERIRKAEEMAAIVWDQNTRIANRSRNAFFTRLKQTCLDFCTLNRQGEVSVFVQKTTYARFLDWFFSHPTADRMLIYAPWDIQDVRVRFTPLRIDAPAEAITAMQVSKYILPILLNAYELGSLSHLTVSIVSHLPELRQYLPMAVNAIRGISDNFFRRYSNERTINVCRFHQHIDCNCVMPKTKIAESSIPVSYKTCNCLVSLVYSPAPSVFLADDSDSDDGSIDDLNLSSHHTPSTLRSDASLYAPPPIVITRPPAQDSESEADVETTIACRFCQNILTLNAEEWAMHNEMCEEENPLSPRIPAEDSESDDLRFQERIQQQERNVIEATAYELPPQDFEDADRFLQAPDGLAGSDYSESSHEIASNSSVVSALTDNELDSVRPQPKTGERLEGVRATHLNLPIRDEIFTDAVIDLTANDIIDLDGGSKGNQIFFANNAGMTEEELVKYWVDRRGQNLHVPDKGVKRLLRLLLMPPPLKWTQAESENLISILMGRLIETAALRNPRKPKRRMEVKNRIVHLVRNKFHNELNKPSVTITGIAGSSKSTLLKSFIKKYYAHKNVLYVTNTNHHKEEVIKQMRGMNVTVDSMHCLPFVEIPPLQRFAGDLKAYDLVIIDEAYAMTAEVIFSIAAFGVRSIVLGDPQQIQSIELAELDEPSRLARTYRGQFSLNILLTVTHTIPQDVLSFLVNAGLYSPESQTTSKVVNSLRFGDEEQIRETDLPVMHFANDFPERSLYEVDQLRTINAVQGSRFKEIGWHVTTQNAMMPIYNRNHIVVALTRHWNNLIFCHSREATLAILNFRNYIVEPIRENIVPLAISRAPIVDGIKDRPIQPLGDGYTYELVDFDFRTLYSKAFFPSSSEALQKLTAVPMDILEKEDTEIYEFVESDISISDIEENLNRIGKQSNPSTDLERTPTFDLYQGSLTSLNVDFSAPIEHENATKFEAAKYICFNQRSSDQFQSLLCATKRSVLPAKEVKKVFLDQVDGIVNDFVDAFLDRDKVFAIDKTSNLALWVAKREKMLVGTTDIPFSQEAFTVKIEQFLKTQSKPAIKQIHSGDYKPGQDVQASSKQFNVLLCPEARQFSMNLIEVARSGLIIDAGYNDEEFKAKLKMDGMIDALKENIQVDITSQSTTHTELHVLVLLSLFCMLGGDPELAELYYEFRRFGVVREKSKYFSLWNTWKLLSGDPFTLIANIVHSLLCLLFRFDDILKKKPALITKGDDNTFAVINMARSEKYAQLEQSLNIGLKIDENRTCYHASRYIIDDFIFPDFVKGILSLMSKSPGVSVEERYQAWLARKFNVPVVYYDQLVIAAMETHGMTMLDTKFFLDFAIWLNTRENFHSIFYSDLVNHRRVVSAKTDCVVAVVKVLLPEFTDFNQLRNQNADQIEQFFFANNVEYERIFTLFDQAFIGEKKNVAYLFEDHVVCYT